MGNSSKSFYYKGIIISDFKGNELAPFKDLAPKTVEVVTSGLIYEVSNEGVLLKQLASINSDGSFIINETRDIEAIACRVISSGYTTIDFSISVTASGDKVHKISIDKLHAPFYNAHQPEVDFVRWRQLPNQGDQEIIFRSDGFMAWINPFENYQFVGRYRTHFQASTGRFNLSTKRLGFSPEPQWTSSINNPTYVVDRNKDLIQTRSNQVVTVFRYS